MKIKMTNSDTEETVMEVTGKNLTEVMASAMFHLK